MANVYSPPSGFEPPTFNSREEPFDKYQERVDAYIKAVCQWAKDNGNGDIAGEVIGFPVADGRALYVVFQVKPLSILHLAVNDAWQFQYVNRLTVKDVREEVRRSKAMKAMFSRKVDKGDDNG